MIDQRPIFSRSRGSVYDLMAERPIVQLLGQLRDDKMLCGSELGTFTSLTKFVDCGDLVASASVAQLRYGCDRGLAPKLLSRKQLGARLRGRQELQVLRR